MTAAQTPTIAEELRAAGLRVTAALLETVRDGDHLGVEAVVGPDSLSEPRQPARHRPLRAR